ncbi:DUF416 family protein [Aliikangiella coralliicola]|uniref:DUF416 family protein n=1 Tax=Aliikangiella coralliicola TaxID=2592383 RepID=A0A545U0D1_9GAMM|nr:DUF416 family protein [Aliikangiella coralliicola]TQV82922.1 DUF416 family protein [Aliikangiella coralliicola]
MNFDANTLNFWQQQVFAAALMQRMLPNYAYFSQTAEFGDYSILTNQLDLVWQKLAGLSIKFNVDAQLDKLQQETPNDSSFEIYAVYPAIDVCTGMECLFLSFQDKEINCAREISQLSQSSVLAYLEFITMQQSQRQADEATLKEDNLFLWEMETQREVFDLVTLIKPNKQGCQKIKSLVMNERLSSLAIEY